MFCHSCLGGRASVPLALSHYVSCWPGRSTSAARLPATSCMQHQDAVHEISRPPVCRCPEPQGGQRPVAAGTTPKVSFIITMHNSPLVS